MNYYSCHSDILELNFLLLIFSRAVECKIFVGIHNLYEITTNHTYASNVFYEHPYYNPKEIKNDVALVELPDEIEFTGNFQRAYTL